MWTEMLKHYIPELKWQLVWLLNVIIWSDYFVPTGAVGVN